LLEDMCPLCKKKSNGAITKGMGCRCHVEYPLDRLDPMYLIENNWIALDMKSEDPVRRRDAHAELFFQLRPRNAPRLSRNR